MSNLPENPKHISIAEFSYELPDENIARYPLAQRDASKLLYYKKGTLEHHSFKNLPELLPQNSCLVFNDTRVIHARMIFRKESGAFIEIFILDPAQPANYYDCFHQHQSCTWNCMVGNLKRWKGDILKRDLHINGQALELEAQLIERNEEGARVQFSWTGNFPFSEVLEQAGTLPIPPYLNRETESSDEQNYQTIFARNEGSVAAPTAGLHFTSDVLDSLAKQGHSTREITLHVGAGTFKPVSAPTLQGHAMHEETLMIHLDVVDELCKRLENKQPIIAVGTTSCRSLESLYWHALRVEMGLTAIDDFHVRQWDPYELIPALPADMVLKNLSKRLRKRGQTGIAGKTGLLIAPPYQYKIITGLITNFHQPQSTLLLLVAALVGKNWKTIYQEALHNKYRFLSYGDSSLLLP
ncbi:S-adenosylmethionine:tRNA ribosyltransferase-isomerase [Bacteroidota bacterium]